MLPVTSPQGGSIKPDPKLIDKQLQPWKYDSPENTKDEYATSEVDSVDLDGRVSIWNKAKTDLTRLGRFEINQHTLIDIANGITPTAGAVFDEIYRYMEGDLEAAKSVVNLLEQDLMINVKNVVLGKKGAFHGEDGETTMQVQGKDRIYSLEIDRKKGTFRLVEEQLFEAYDIEQSGRINMDMPKYFKAKIIVSGKLNDLSESNAKNIQSKIVYSKEYQTREATKTAKYSRKHALFKDRATLLT